MSKVLIAVPHTGVIDALLSQRIVQMMLDTRYQVAYHQVKGRPRDVPRSKIMRLVLTAGYDFLIMIDSDNPPIANVVDLIELNLPVICCPTPYVTLRPPFNVGWNVWCKDADGVLREPRPMSTGLFEIDECGAGLMVLRRDVIEVLGESAFASTVNPETGISNDDDDTAFCHKCQRAGIKLYAHGGYLCRHIKGGIDLYDVMTRYHPEWMPGYKPTGDGLDPETRARERARVETQNQAAREAGIAI